MLNLSLLGHLGLAAGIILLIIYYRPTRALEHLSRTSSQNTRMIPTYYEIYDKSPDPKVCDRLIYVQPFGWLIWAILGQVYILNDNNAICPISSTPATIVPHDGRTTFPVTCLEYALPDIVKLYESCRSVRIPIELDADIKRFTILDALNHLFQFAITLSGPATEPPPKHRSKRSLVNVTAETSRTLASRLQERIHSHTELLQLYRHAKQGTAT